MQPFNVFVMSILPKLFHKFNETLIKILHKEIKIVKDNFKKQLGLYNQQELPLQILSQSY